MPVLYFVPPELLGISKLDGIGPVDNKPFTNKLHHFVKKKKIIIITCDI